jgi:hypothetical protein
MIVYIRILMYVKASIGITAGYDFDSGHSRGATTVLGSAMREERPSEYAPFIYTSSYGLARRERLCSHLRGDPLPSGDRQLLYPEQRPGVGRRAVEPQVT